jgi:hypothetical protein
MDGEAQAFLEVMSGPEDGKVVTINSSEVVLGPAVGALLLFPYDNAVPQGGVKILLREGDLLVGTEVKRYGELFKVGQIWLRILRPQKEA